MQQPPIISSVPDQKPPMRVSNDLRRVYTLLWCVIYLMVYHVFRDAVPDAFLRDADKIADLVVGGGWEASASFMYTAQILSLIPLPLQDIVVNVIGIVSIVALLSPIRTLWGMAIIPVLLVPLMLSSMLAPTKETIVILLTLFVAMTAYSRRAASQVLWIIVALYAAYCFIRIYYAITLALLLSFIIIERTTPMLRVLYVFACIAVAMLLPDQVYMQLQGSRDTVAHFLTTGSMFEVRTVFFNLYPPDSFWHFICNYVYAFVVLNFPFVRFMTYKEFILFANVVLWFSLCVTGLRYVDGPKRYLIFLFIGHLMVSILFEPDFGSYMRHTSSTFIYLLPALAIYEQRRLERRYGHAG
ncbi:MAG: hypothetical protein GC131_05680 [Alphaproteobacteria bacterium]|nr:hypothetical protein [Alphaproteobacteria bacterium]